MSRRPLPPFVPVSSLFAALLAAAGCGSDPAAGGDVPAPGPAGTVAPEESAPLTAVRKEDGDSSGAAEAPAARGPAPAPVPVAPGPTAAKVIAAARLEVARKAGYDPKYYGMKYPGGDVPGGGVCTDLVVRAFRGAGIDLQKLVHEDMSANFADYPQKWGLAGPDPNIDHRRVANLMRFFRRRGRWLTTSLEDGQLVSWRPGDVVFWDLGSGGRQHCGVISDRRGGPGRPLVIHNIAGAAEEDCLQKWKIIGHARMESGSAADTAELERAWRLSDEPKG